ncbi:MAG: hypothetical protein IJU16_04670 [Clostridia bacterium]|nr:hypothetical protein [Clostridia bacterium]
MNKRLLALLLSVFLLLTVFSAVYADEETEATEETAEDEVVLLLDEEEEVETFDFQEYASNANFSLSCDEKTTFICLKDKRTGQEWYSNPPIPLGSDPYVQGIAQTDIRSVMHVTYTNAAMKVKETNSYSGSVMKNAAKVKKQANGLRVDYRFTELKATIPVRYTLTDDGMKAEILFSEIEEETTNYINNIDFLTYFGAAGEKDEGYLVIPDGSGALVRFNNQKNMDGMAYKQSFYGDDLAAITDSSVTTSRMESITLPVYGIVKNGYGFLAEVTSGVENASLKAATSGNRLVGAYNIVYTNAVYHTYYSLPLMGQIATERSNVLYNAQDRVSSETYTVEYHFAADDKTDYVSLASMYRTILTTRGWLSKNEVEDAFYAEFYGGVNKTKSFAGILYTARETLTSFQDAQAILESLKAGGVSKIHATYQCFSDDFFASDLEVKLNPSGSLGGGSAMAELLSYAADNGVTLGVAADFIDLPSGGNGYSTFWDVADAINISPIKVYPTSLNSNTQDTSKKPYYLIDPQKYQTAIESLQKAIADHGYTGLYFDDDALELYSDLAPNGYQRERTVTTQSEAMDALAQTDAAIVMSNPNAYMFAYADQMVNIPVTSSNEILFDEDVPFLQTVLRGMVNIAGENMNITDVSETAFLKHLEYGTDLRYALMEADSEVLLNTDMTFLYSAKYEVYKDEIPKRWKAFEEFGKAVGSANISAHKKDGNVAVTTYDNGAKVYVNYGATAATIDGVTVEPLSYAIH